MKCKVKPYKSVRYLDIWYNQGDIIDVSDGDAIPDDAELFEENEKETKEEEA